jgi:chemotaxis protein methyltransferase WspC
VNLPAIEDVLRQRIGFDVQSIGRSGVVRAVEQRVAALGLDDAAAYATLLCQSGEELQELVEQIVVPETWFFRHAEAYVELLSVSARWLTGERAPARLLSVPCSTGEEPYSIAMTLFDRGIAKDRFTIDAIDISHRNLAAAERGVFGRNSLRAESGPAASHLEPVRNGYAVSVEARRQVRFAQGNVLAADFLTGAAPYDVIFCRNLLIYFDAAAQQRALRTLERLLAPDGVLFVGPGDGFAALTFGFESTGRSGAFGFRKSSRNLRHRNAATVGSTNGSPAAKRAAPPFRKTARPRGPNKATAGTTATAVAAPAEPTTLAEAQALADAGRIVEAAAACRRHLEVVGPSADAFYLLALVTDALGDRRQAIECYRKALYLNPVHAEALAQLALLTAERGDGARAGVLAARARRAARDSDQGEV